MTIPLLIYTNGKYKDLWNPLFGRMDKWFPSNQITILNDNEYLDLKSYDQVVYSDDKVFTEEMSNCLSQIKYDHFIFLQDDFILYEPPDLGLMNQIKGFFLDSEYDFVRLIRSGEHQLIPSEFDRLYHCNMVFSYQATMWKMDSFKEVFASVPYENFATFEHVTNNGFLRHKGLFYYDGERRVGSAHWDSKLFPYVATAIVKGKWNTRQYEKELEILFKEFKIDKSIRGTNS